MVNCEVCGSSGLWYPVCGMPTALCEDCAELADNPRWVAIAKHVFATSR